MKELSNASIIRHLESRGKYCKVRISIDGSVTGMLVNENYRYNRASNSGGRRYIGDRFDRDFLMELEWEMGNV